MHVLPYGKINRVTGIWQTRTIQLYVSQQVIAYQFRIMSPIRRLWAKPATKPIPESKLNSRFEWDLGPISPEQFYCRRARLTLPLVDLLYAP